MRNGKADERARLNWLLIENRSERRALNRVRGPLGHGVIYIADKEERRARLDAEYEEIRRQLEAL
jgi:hypothetical protein